MDDIFYAILVGDDTQDDGSLSSMFWPGPYSTISSLTRELLKTPFWPVLLPAWLENAQANKAKEKVDAKSDKKEKQEEKVSDKKIAKHSMHADFDLVTRLKHELDRADSMEAELFRLEIANLSKQKDERIFDEAEHGLLTCMKHVLMSYHKLIEAFLEHNNLKHSK